MGRKILIVDDSSVERVLLTGLLENEYDVIEASGGSEALSVIKSRHGSISVVLLDIMMPGMDGFEVLKHIKLSGLYRALPVIVITGISDEEAQIKALKLGAIAYISKPFNQRLLLEMLRNTIELCESAALANELRLDKLTRLLNREAFFAEAEKMIARKPSSAYMLSCFDVEGFKVINEQYGTKVGDAVLKHIAECIERSVAGMDAICCRHTADQFAILFPADQVNSDSIRFSYKEVTKSPQLDQPIKMRIGQYLVEDASLPISSMYDRAVLAEESIKGRYDVCVAVYHDDMRKQMLREQEIVGEMRAALASGQFEAWYQPQYNHTSGALIGAEALVRWKHPEKGIIPPNDFIPVFERNGFIYEMDKFIWEQVCIYLRRKLDAGYDPVPVSVNVSRQDIFHSDFLDVVTGLVKKYDLPADKLRLEVTESAFAENTNTIVSIVTKLIQQGFTVEIDDFGSGYSSLNTLKDVPAQILKLDLRFLERTGNAQRSGSIVESIIRMAKWLEMSVIAEGVENKAQADYLKSVGCSYIQGYFYARPMPLADYDALSAKSGKQQGLDDYSAVKNFDNSAFWTPGSLDTMVFNHFSGGAFIFEVVGGHYELLRVNDEFSKTLRSPLSNEDILKLAPFSKLDEKERVQVGLAVERALKSGKAESFECFSAGFSAPGKGQFVRVTIRRIAACGSRVLFYGYIDNITAEREAQQKERQLSDRIKAILDNTKSGIMSACVKDGKLVMLFANDHYFAQLGYTREQFKKEVPIYYLTIHPEDRARISQEIAAILKDKVSRTLEYRCVKRDGGVINIRCNASITAIDGIDGEVMITVEDDVTALVNAMTEREQTANQIDAIMRNIEGGVCVADFISSTPKSLIANDYFYRMFGCTKEEFERDKADPFDFILSDDRTQMLKEAEEDRAARRPHALRYRIKRKDGAIRYLSGNVSFITLPGVNRPVELSVTLDVTDRREASIKALEAEQMEHEQTEQLRFLNEVSASLLAQPDTERGITDTLRRILDFFDGARAYIFEFYDEKKFMRNTYEVCAKGIAPQIENLRNVSMSITPYLLTAFDTQRIITIDVDELDKDRLEERELLQMQGIRSLAAAPLMLDGEYIGVVGVDNPKNKGQYEYLAALGDYMTVLLTRRDLNRRISVQEHRQAELLDNLPCGAALYEFDGKELAVKHLNRHYWQMVGRACQEYDDISFIDAVYKDDRLIIAQELAAAIRQGRNFSASVRILCGDGAYHPFHITGNIVKQATGKYLIYAAYTQIGSDEMAVQSMLRLALDAMMDSSADFTFVKDVQGRYVSVSNSLAEFLGFDSNAAIIGKSDAEVFGEAFAKSYASDDCRVLNRGEIVLDNDESICGAGGEMRFISTSKYPLRDAENNIIGLYGISRNTTTLHTAQFELDALLHSIPSGIVKYSADEKKEFAYVNRNLIEGLGYTERSFREKFHNCFHEMIYIEDRAYAQQEIERQEGGGGIGRFDYRIEAADGSLRYFHDEGVKVADENGKEWYYVVLTDITRQKKAEAQFQSVSDSIPGGIAAYACTSEQISPATLKQIYFSEGYCALFGYTREEYIESAAHDPVGNAFKEDVPGLVEQIARGHRDGTPIDYVYRIHVKGGKMKWVNIRGNMSEKAAGTVIINVVLLDVTEKINAERQLLTSAEEFRLAVNDSGITICRYDIAKRTLSMSDGAVSKYGMKKTVTPFPESIIKNGEVAPGSLEAFTAFFDSILAGKPDGTALYQRKLNGSWKWLEAHFSSVFSEDGKPESAVISFRDVTEQIQIEKRADTDPLTGLLNRTAFSERMNNLLKQSGRGALYALLMLDLDHFKQINDTYGHSAGDETLIHFGEVLVACVRAEDMVCRLGGDEFFVCLCRFTSRLAIQSRAKHICEQITAAFPQNMQVSTSIGIAVGPDDGTDFETLYHKADSALYHVKEHGKNGYAFYGDGMGEKSGYREHKRDKQNTEGRQE